MWSPLRDTGSFGVENRKLNEGAGAVQQRWEMSFVCVSQRITSDPWTFREGRKRRG